MGRHIRARPGCDRHDVASPPCSPWVSGRHAPGHSVRSASGASRRQRASALAAASGCHPRSALLVVVARRRPRLGALDSPRVRVGVLPGVLRRGCHTEDVHVQTVVAAVHGLRWTRARRSAGALLAQAFQCRVPGRVRRCSRVRSRRRAGVGGRRLGRRRRRARAPRSRQRGRRQDVRFNFRGPRQAVFVEPPCRLPRPSLGRECRKPGLPRGGAEAVPGEVASPTRFTGNVLHASGVQ